ncbi:hypothetical protein BBB56_14630 [Candidatus Pantoea deserta]|uniref:Uncharacterized protein n=1 Tax=Candidatus Pantoea deserta TaxID=1869313 RepID=A0A3N4NT76_9GAMM|nr:hypothetical protein BBB56_14630 [Pantoea deserta]
MQKRLINSWLVTFCRTLLRLGDGSPSLCLATVRVPEVLMGEHQLIFLITPTCADAQVFFCLPRDYELIHSFSVNRLTLSL